MRESLWKAVWHMHGSQSRGTQLIELGSADGLTAGLPSTHGKTCGHGPQLLETEHRKLTPSARLFRKESKEDA